MESGGASFIAQGDATAGSEEAKLDASFRSPVILSKASRNAEREDSGVSV